MIARIHSFFHQNNYGSRENKTPLPSLAAVTPVPVGRDDDGLTYRGSTIIDKPWPEQFQEMQDAREAWRDNPLARRLVGLITSYTVGNGIALTSEHKPLARFIADFWQRNTMDLRVEEWSDELSRAGELFIVLFTNPISGMSTIRAIPASLIHRVDANPDDYEDELAYEETTDAATPYRTWTAEAHVLTPTVPGMLHYAINRPLGALRGDSDLAPILPWLRRYSRWLEDRVRLNAAVRAFLWIVKAPARIHADLRERYIRPPEAGSVIIADENETWTAAAPTLHAADAESDGRAIRWMIVAGGPGTGLLDIGEGEDSNQATGTVMQEQRRRQSFIVWLLTDLTLAAWRRYVTVTGTRTRSMSYADMIARVPDISPEDNNELASAAASLANSLHTMATLTGTSDAYRKQALRLWHKFIGEPVTDQQLDEMLAEPPEQQQPTAETQRSQRTQRKDKDTQRGLSQRWAPFGNRSPEEA